MQLDEVEEIMSDIQATGEIYPLLEVVNKMSEG
ncbi:hypothetical protein JOC73_002713 [Alkaliphilus hydrothermalis]|uniref:Uncharacterized protein n=1 Tax=Alkaliphilus hydrothermalis TaxID=1482730 RepID=A0ABS2NTE2_9FIRM|nr:hypothetical protein [Alkaliphilus hydrothermalis]